MAWRPTKFETRFDINEKIKRISGRRVIALRIQVYVKYFTLICCICDAVLLGLGGLPQLPMKMGHILGEFAGNSLTLKFAANSTNTVDIHMLKKHPAEELGF